jgi:hypothetical protein
MQATPTMLYTAIGPLEALNVFSEHQARLEKEELASERREEDERAAKSRRVRTQWRVWRSSEFTFPSSFLYLLLFLSLTLDCLLLLYVISDCLHCKTYSLRFILSNVLLCLFQFTLFS